MPGAWYEKGTTLQRDGENTGRTGLFRQALSQNPDSIIVLFNKGWCLSPWGELPKPSKPSMQPSPCRTWRRSGRSGTPWPTSVKGRVFQRRGTGRKKKRILFPPHHQLEVLQERLEILLVLHLLLEDGEDDVCR